MSSRVFGRYAVEREETAIVTIADFIPVPGDLEGTPAERTPYSASQ